MEPERVAAANSEITILYEDTDCVVIDKPVGLLVHEAGQGTNGEKESTVVEWLVSRSPEATGVGEPGFAPDGTVLDRSGVVHRLDRDTSGVLILAKTQAAHEHLKAEFHDRRAVKEYRALVYGMLNEQWGTIDRPIGRSAKDFRKRSAERGAKGMLRDAVTNFERIGTGEVDGEPFSYVKLLPKTGRTHQLRVHMKAIDRPIVGDKLYGGKKFEQSHNLGLSRLALHAHILELTLPSGEPRRFIAPVPNEMERAVERVAQEEAL